MKRRRYLTWFILVLIATLLLATAPVAVAATYAQYVSHSGTVAPTGGTIPLAVATADNKFVQLAPDSWVLLCFPGNTVAVPDGTAAPDLRVHVYDTLFPADAEVLVSGNGSTWTSMGVHADTVDIDLDLEVKGPVKYVKVDQAGHYIDPAYPNLGFDLNAVEGLNMGDISLSAANVGDAVNPIGAMHTVEASISPVIEGVEVSFDISGPNSGESGTANTNASGVASFTYTGSAPGTDSIVASVTFEGTTISASPVEKIWYDKFVSGGGQLVEELGPKRKDWHVISFGGFAASAGGSGYIGDWQVNFHNVGDDAFDKSRFHTTSIVAMTFLQGSCGIAMNFTAMGEWNGEPGYKMIFRAQDAEEPGTLDNVRIHLFDGSVQIYDTNLGDFVPESTCFGTARTLLDNGNLQMAVLP